MISSFDPVEGKLADWPKRQARERALAARQARVGQEAGRGALRLLRS